MTTVAAVTLVAAVAAFVSYRHMRGVAVGHGEDSMTAAVLPFSVDGLIVAASMTMLADRRAGRRRSGLSYALLTLGACASLAANVLHAEPTLTARVIAAWPPLALLGSYELLMRQIHPTDPAARRQARAFTGVQAPHRADAGGSGIPNPRAEQSTVERSPLFLAPAPVPTPAPTDAIDLADLADLADITDSADLADLIELPGGHRAGMHEVGAEDAEDTADLPDTAAQSSGPQSPGLDATGKRDAIIHALEQTGGSASHASALLAARGISVSKSWVYQVRKETHFADVDTGPLAVPLRHPVRLGRGLGRGLTPDLPRGS
ncbi:DUF2637 domain-containing protein [Frankia sp. Cr2]|uniref:DUF2637 domain-containing protein n=1 Tax=Frankia sp. Cr2 TaxID=3073932 RepID=UPI002AD448E9|nr:DUF2637 domain-containing protein [Frankia sp. Cr2]